MGQKVDPNGLRTGVIKPWSSKWYADKAHFADNIVEDDKIRKFIKKKYYEQAISKIVIERAADKVVVAIHTARPAVLIGKAGAGVEEIKKEVESSLLPARRSTSTSWKSNIRMQTHNSLQKTSHINLNKEHPSVVQ